jgi:hypothetical protein
LPPAGEISTCPLRARADLFAACEHGFVRCGPFVLLSVLLSACASCRGAAVSACYDLDLTQGMVTAAELRRFHGRPVTIRAHAYPADSIPLMHADRYERLFLMSRPGAQRLSADRLMVTMRAPYSTLPAGIVRVRGVLNAEDRGVWAGEEYFAIAVASMTDGVLLP